MLRRICETAKWKDGVTTTNNDDKHEEYQYISMIKDIINHGELVEGRNGKTYVLCGGTMHFSLANNTLPLLTTKKVAWKTCLRELLWFISGHTDNKLLKNKNVKIWNGNASREFLDSRNLTHLKEDDLGPVYGHQWRHFNAPYTTCENDYTGQGVDQLQYIIDSLIDPEKRYSRRLIMSAWNPCQINEMALPPCHVLVQFHVVKNKLSCSLYQRSGDMGLGVPFNIASYSFLTHLIAKHCNLVADEFYYHLGNCHVYDDHIDALASQVKRIPNVFPTISIKNKKENISNYSEDDFEIHNYISAKKISMKMRT